MILFNVSEGDFKLAFDEYVKNTSESIVGKNNSKIECFKRIIILLPEDCTINMNTFEAKECVFKHVPGRVGQGVKILFDFRCNICISRFGL